MNKITGVALSLFLSVVSLATQAADVPPFSHNGPPPPIPANFQMNPHAQSPDLVQLDFEWDEVVPFSENRIVYQLYAKPRHHSGDWDVHRESYGGTTTVKLTPNEHYEFKLRACHRRRNERGTCSDWTATKSFHFRPGMELEIETPTEQPRVVPPFSHYGPPPPTPEDFRMTYDVESQRSIRLDFKWDEVVPYTEDRIVYQLYARPRHHGGDWDVHRESYGSSTTVKLSPNERYEFKLRACHRRHNERGTCSEWTAIESFHFKPEMGQPFNTGAAMGLQVSSTTVELNDFVGLTWNAIQHADRYRFWQSINGKETYSDVHQNQMDIQHTVVGNYQYSVQACKGSQCTGWSATLTVTTPEPVVTEEDLLAELRTETIEIEISNPVVRNHDAARLRWNLLSLAEYYEVQQTYNGKDYHYTTDQGALNIRHLHYGDYAYRVRACRHTNNACGDWSNTLQVSTPQDFSGGTDVFDNTDEIEDIINPDDAEALKAIEITAPADIQLNYEFIDENTVWLILRWNPFNPNAPYLVNYELERAPVNDAGEVSGEFVQIDDADRTQSRLQVSRGERFAFRLRYCLVSSFVCGEYSDVVEFDFNASLDANIEQAKKLRSEDLGVPANFKADPFIVDMDTIELNLTWDEVASPNGLSIIYQLEAAPVVLNDDKTRKFGAFETIFANPLTQKIETLEQGDYYAYRVRSCVLDGFKCSRWSAYRHFNFKQDAEAVADIETRRRAFDEANPFVFSLFDYVEAQVALAQTPPPIPPAIEQKPENRQGYYVDEIGNWAFVYPFSTPESDTEARAKEVRELERGAQYFRTWTIGDDNYSEWQTTGYEDLDLTDVAFIQWSRTRCNDYGCSELSAPLTLKVAQIQLRTPSFIPDLTWPIFGDLPPELIQKFLDGEIVPTIPGNLRLNRYSHEDPNHATVIARWNAATVEHYDSRTITYHLHTAKVSLGPNGEKRNGPFSPVSGCNNKALNCTATLTDSGFHAFKIQACVLNGNNCSDLADSPTKYFEFKKQYSFSTLKASTNLSRNGTYTIDSHLQQLISTLAPHEASRARENLYGLEESINGGPWRKIAGVDSVASKRFTNKAAGTYRYRRNINKANLYDQPITVKVEKIPAKMAKPTLTGQTSISDSSFRINWGNGNNGATRYELRTRQNVFDGNGRYSGWAIWNMKGAHFVDQEHESQTIQYQVRACIGNTQNQCGAWSEALTVTHLNKPSKAIKPTLHNKNGDTDRSFTVNWIGAEGFNMSRYELSRRLRPIGSPDEEAYYNNWQRIVNENVKTAQQNNLGFNHYQYRVRGCNAAGCGSWSNSLSTRVIQTAITPPPKNPPPKPGAPKLSVSEGEMRIDWGGSSSATYYRIRERIDGGDWEIIPGGTHHSIDREATNEGLYEYQLQACNSDGCSEWSQSANKKLIVTMDIPDNPLDDVSAYSLPAHDASMGAIDGKHQANTDGSLSYSVDIPVPAGRAGLTPQLSLSYNSESGNGLLGMGWDIGGLSRIHRCGANVAVDGEHRGINFDDSDQLCLDGQRMIGNPADYGKGYAEYRLLLQPGTQIVALGPEGSLDGSDESDSAAFQVKTADGKILTYGEQQTSRLSRHLDMDRCSPLVRLTQGCNQWYRQNITRTYQWMLSRIEDRKGNRIDLVYVNDDDHGDIRLSRVEYNDGLHHIDFQWESRDDVTEAYFAGGLVTMKHRLKQVTTYANRTALRRLGLVYQSNQPVSRLQRITSCSGTNKDCLQPTAFTWTNGEKGYDAPQDLMAGNIWKEGNSPRVADFNQDGFDDVLSAHGSNWHIAYGGTLGLGNWHNSRFPLTGNWHYSVLIDYNGDGRPDILWPFNGQWRVAIKNEDGHGFSTRQTTIPAHGYKHRPRVIDLNGDGRSDLVYLRDDVWRYRLMKASGGLGNEISTGAHIGEHKDDEHRLNVLVMDFDGDGLQDLLVPKDPYYYAYLANGEGKFDVIQTSLRLPGFKTSPQVLDINGDGLQDIVIRDSGNGGMDTLSYVLNKGAAFTERRKVVLTDGTPLQVDQKEWNSLTHSVDFDLDGRSDIWHKDKVIHFKGNRVIAERSNRYWHGKLQKDDQYALTLDVNGDFMDDMVLFNRSGSSKLYVHGGVRPDYLKTVTNGFGLKTTFVYSDLQGNSDIQGHPDQAFYTDNSEASYPLVKAGKSAYVIKQVKQDNGKGGNNTASYRYEGLRHHQAGLGSLGFKKHTQIIDATGVKTVTTFSQDYKKYRQGRATRIETTAKSGQLLSRTVNTWENAERGGYYTLDPVNVRLKKNTQLNKDLNGSVLSFEASDYRYDDFNNLKTMTKKVYNGGSENSGVYRTVVTANEWINNESDWILGLVTETKNTVTVTGEDPIINLTRTEYDESTGYKLNESIIDPGDESTALHTTTYSDQDNFGNIEKITLSGPDFANRSAISKYDTAHGLAIVKKTNALNQSETLSYYAPDGAIASGAYPGKLKESKSINGIRTRYLYDSYGRLRRTIAAYGSASPISTYSHIVSCTAGHCREGAVYQTIAYTDGQSPTLTEIDKLGRTVRQKTYGVDGRLVWVDTDYNALGQVERVSEPYFANDSTFWTRYQYDGIGRPVKTISPDDRTDQVIHNGLTVTYRSDINGKNQQKVETKTPMGWLKTVVDNDNNTLSYAYNSAGQVRSVTTPGAGTIETDYDVLGHKTRMKDPDKGTWHYRHNALGQIITQTNAKGVTSCVAYDLLGRMVKRDDHFTGSIPTAPGDNAQANQGCGGSGGELQTRWDYYTSTGAKKGLLKKVTSPDHHETFDYDGLGRPTVKTVRIDSQDMTINTSYDRYSRPSVVSYPASVNGFDRVQVKSRYNALGFVTGLYSADDTVLYSRPEVVDARGNVRESTLGNGVQTYTDINERSGLVSRITSTHVLDLLRITEAQMMRMTRAASHGIQDAEYQFDKLGNLESRIEHSTGFSETFGYDGLNRLTDVWSTFTSGNGRQHSEVSYYANGNIKTKTGVGTYTYGGSCGGVKAGPHAVTSISGAKNASYCYDKNGNMVSGDGRTFTYTDFDKPDLIRKGNNQVAMRYGTDRQLVYRKDVTGNDEKVTLLVDGLYERVSYTKGSQGGKREDKYYIGGSVILTQTKAANGTRSENVDYLHKDHLGSLVAITNPLGELVKRFSFDAWGKRRQPDVFDYDAANDPFNALTPALKLGTDITQKGFTGHEQLDNVGIIHMGGRIYDAEIGRFLQADPIIQEATNLQAFNRYTYVSNNPLSYTDPTGYSWNPLKKLGDFHKKVGSKLNHWRKHHTKTVGRFLNKNPELQIISTIVVTVACWGNPACGTAWGAWLAGLNMAATASRQYAAGAPLSAIARGAIISGITSLITAGIMDGVPVTDLSSGQIAGVLFTSGVMSEAGGGSFIDGVKGGAIGLAFSAVMQAKFGDAVQKPVTANEKGDVQGETVATVRISARGEAHALGDTGHASVGIQLDGEQSHTYGTWGTGSEDTQGLRIDFPDDMAPADGATRILRIDQAHYDAAMSVVTEYQDLGWSLGRPCSSFARDFWAAATGEHLNANYGPISNPLSLKQSIQAVNVGSYSGTGKLGRHVGQSAGNMSVTPIQPSLQSAF